MFKVGLALMALVSCLGISYLFYPKPTLFSPVPSSHSNIHFRNTITESDSLNVLNFEYIYNGGGVAVADFNNDGLPDLFFSGSQVDSKLYLNRGGLVFDDVTEAAGITSPYWSTGVSIADVNSDGLADIYLCNIHPSRGKSVPNQLFLNKGTANNGIPSFEDIAPVVGLDDNGYSTQAAFLDYDRDGDLDMYLLSNGLESYNRAIPVGQRTDGRGSSNDRLFRNEGPGADHLPRFTNVSSEAGINTEGWGLGVAVSDINQDGWPDIYCANDFQSNDILWINNQNGTFTNRIADMIRHQSSNSMGIDIADMNNDALPDIFVVDMLPEDNLRKKSMFSRPNYEMFHFALATGYQPQYIRNVLQLNRGMCNGEGPYFSEVGLMAGVEATDWSWAPLFADFDNDGFKDLLVTNGYRKDITNLDFAAYSAQPAFQFSGSEKFKTLKLQELNKVALVKKSNVAFRNTGTVAFEDVTEKWGLRMPSYSNGAVYADLDNDGDLDIVVNNIDDEAFLFENNSSGDRSRKQAGYLKVIFAGATGNLDGIGAKVLAFAGGTSQYFEQSVCRGYKSSVDPRLHIGLGAAQSVDSLIVTWPSGTSQTLYGIPANTTITLSESESEKPAEARRKHTDPIFRSSADQRGISFMHRESDFVDFKVQRTLLHKYSQDGPAIAVGDINGDGHDDFIVGGARGVSPVVFMAKPDGTFSSAPLQEDESASPETAGMLLLDADGDKDLDLYLVTGSYESEQDKLRDRLFRNDGQGNFTHDVSALPDKTSAGSCAVAADFDKDGDLDMFVAGRVVPGAYPASPRSYLLVNNGHGSFSDQTMALAPALSFPGLLNAALWSDFNNDGWHDLIVAGEFTQIMAFQNLKGERFIPLAKSGLEKTSGWWNSIAGCDFDQDGDLDYVAGNIGLNYSLRATEEHPVRCYARDFNGDGLIDPIFTHYLEGKEHIVHFRETLTDQITGLKKKLTSYSVFGALRFSDIFSGKDLSGALVLKAERFSSVYIENHGDGKFSVRDLPAEVQFSSVQGLVVDDFNRDGYPDIFAAGNSYGPEVISGRLDASYGTLLIGTGTGRFTVASLAEQGVALAGDVKSIAIIMVNNSPVVLASTNRGPLHVFEGSTRSRGGAYEKVLPDNVSAKVVFRGGKHSLIEFTYGSGYLSHSSRYLHIPEHAKEVTITSVTGETRSINIPAPASEKHLAAKE